MQRSYPNRKTDTNFRKKTKKTFRGTKNTVRAHRRPAERHAAAIPPSGPAHIRGIRPRTVRPAPHPIAQDVSPADTNAERPIRSRRRDTGRRHLIHHGRHDVPPGPPVTRATDPDSVLNSDTPWRIFARKRTHALPVFLLEKHRERPRKKRLRYNHRRPMHFVARERLELSTSGL